jgi:NAD(P)-dependent dehydrogenase (short-subunit alcohol dehydrogenase family)
MILAENTGDITLDFRLRRRSTMLRKTLLFGSAAVAAGIAVALRRPQSVALRGKVVLITGGSRGLGLALARTFASHGCRLALCARNFQELESAKADLAAKGAEVFTVQCDVVDRDRVQHMIAAVLARFGHIDVLVNNAGIIHVGPMDSMDLDDFRVAMDVMFWGPVHTALAVLPHMRDRREGRIVNITSVGAKVAVPHLMPYSCAKFAAAAFSEGMRAELRGSGIKVVTIAPGLMRTGSYLNAVFKGAEEGEAVWFSLSASLPGISMSADRAARQIVRATERGTAERILSVPANLLARFHGLFPGITTELLSLVSAVLPHGRGETRRGADSRILRRPWLRALMPLGRLAARRYLQPSV